MLFPPIKSRYRIYLLITFTCWILPSFLSSQNHRDIIIDDSVMIAYPQPAVSSLKSLLIPLTICSRIVHSEDCNYSIRQNHVYPRTHQHSVDLPLAALPLAALYTLKATGVEGKSSWQRSLAGNASGLALAWTLSQINKKTVRSTRPDGTGARSFPSDHSLLAFASAAMLDEEYGHISPWISIGGYSVATLAAFSRIAGNRHWVSDIISSYTLGNTATRVGYALTDLWQHNMGIILEDQPFIVRFYDQRPSYIGTYSSIVTTLGHTSGQEHDLYMKTGYAAGVSGGYYFKNRLGIGVKTGISTYLPKIDNQPQPFTVNYWDCEAGLLYYIPLHSRWNMEAQLMEGYHSITEGKHQLETAGIHQDRLFSTSVGIQFDYRVKKHLSTRIMCSYNLYHTVFHQQTFTMGISTNYRF